MYREMPKSMKELSYRIVDVSTVKELCKRWYPEVYKNMPSKNSEVRI
jgi:oligoribonuclease